MGELDQRRVLVTGATSGLGAAMAQALANAGARVALAARPGARLDEALARHRLAGHTVVGAPMDVRDATSVDRAARRALEELGGLDMVVNNAGIGMRTVNPRFLTSPAPFYHVSPEGFADVVATNLTGYFLVARAFAPYFVAQRRGSFVNVTMNHETMRRRGFVPYGPSRAGAESLSAIMAEDLREDNVSVNMLLPGGASATGMIPAGVEATLARPLLDPTIMGPPIVFLASNRATGLSGARLIATEFDQWLATYEGGSTS